MSKSCNHILSDQSLEIKDRSSERESNFMSSEGYDSRL